ncbi:MAG: hypothetical protein HN802_00820, partial [Candidatus Jacksonbacteria bacterium]|nr:hypothetical protein [Candidatus Jacksonbacteria bacterium]
VTATLDATAIKIASGTAMTAIKDEDNMLSDSATSLSTQQSIKAYVDAQVDTADALSELADTTITTPSDSDFLVHNGSVWVNESGATARTSLGVDASGTINYTHPNHSGDVTSVNDGATTIANDAVTYAKMQNVSASDRILGRDTAGAGDVEEISPSALRTMINVEDGATADQSDTEIKTAYENNADTNEFSDAEQTKLSGIEASADVTDATNVNSAGAVMESDISGTPAGSIIDDDTMATASDTTLATSESIKAYAQSLVASSVEYVGGYNASTNSPDLDTSPSGVTKGDMYTVTVAGTFFTQALEVGDVLISEQDSPTLLTDWSVVNKDLDASSIKTSYESNADTNAYTDAEVTKLSLIATSATANDTDVNLKARANHTGTQTTSTISNFDMEVANNSAVTANTAKTSNATHTGDVIGDTALTIDNLKVTNAHLAGSIANTKLSTNPLARANHTGTQTASTISDFDTEVANNSAVTTNTAKVSNVTHTGDVTGSTSLSIASDVVGASELGVTAGTVTASKAVVVDASSKVDVWNVDNLKLNGNAITSENTNGNITLMPNGIGKVGIGTSSPGAKLEVSGTIKSISTGAAHLILNGDTNNSGDTGEVDSIIDLLGDGNPGIYGYRINTENWSGQTALNFQEYLNGSYTSRLFISKDGNVGIGTASPSYTLDVAGNIGYSGVILDYSDKRLKENIEDADLDLCYSTVKNLN